LIKSDLCICNPFPRDVMSQKCIIFSYFKKDTLKGKKWSLGSRKIHKDTWKLQLVRLRLYTRCNEKRKHTPRPLAWGWVVHNFQQLEINTGINDSKGPEIYLRLSYTSHLVTYFCNVSPDYLDYTRISYSQILLGTYGIQ
jgi:hypothetical protein